MHTAAVLVHEGERQRCAYSILVLEVEKERDGERGARGGEEQLERRASRTHSSQGFTTVSLYA
jgi:hypothetical protein